MMCVVYGRQHEARSTRSMKLRMVCGWCSASVIHHWMAALAVRKRGKTRERREETREKERWTSSEESENRAEKERSQRQHGPCTHTSALFHSDKTVCLFFYVAAHTPLTPCALDTLALCITPRRHGSFRSLYCTSPGPCAAYCRVREPGLSTMASQHPHFVSTARQASGSQDSSLTSDHCKPIGKRARMTA